MSVRHRQDGHSLGVVVKWGSTEFVALPTLQKH